MLSYTLHIYTHLQLTDEKSANQNQTKAQIHNHIAANKKTVIMTWLAWTLVFHLPWEIAAGLLKCVRFRAWVCERHLPGSCSDSTHLTAGISAVCPDTPSERET